MEFLLLGPLEVRHGGESLMLGPRRAQRCLLGLLLLETGRMVPADRLADLLWDDDPPDNARAILQTHVSRLRAAMDPHRDGRHGVRLIGQGTGYKLEADPNTVDAFRFRAMVSNAEAVVDPAGRALALREALALWRGPFMADVADDRLRDRVGTGLVELRLHAWEVCIEAELDLGRHRKVISEINDLISGNPLRERLAYLLMSALYRDGQQAAALEAFHAAHERIAESTGLDPGPQLQDLRAAILRGDPLPPTSSSPPAVTGPAGNGPRQLPSDISHFVGRESELSDLVGVATTHRGHFPGVASIHGPGGIGKSALAVHAAHSVSALFPDGQLYLDLQGSTPGLLALTPGEALRRLLRGLGIDSREIPHTDAECSSALRHATSGRRMLFLLDNAMDAAQVKPLLPAAPTCFVLVTSRAILSTLDNAVRIRLESLTEPEAVELLGRFDGRALQPAEHDSATAIVRRCGHLPLAIRVVGARLAAEPGQGLSEAAERLAHERIRLGELELDDLSVRASISVSHQQLQADPSGHVAAGLLQGMGVLNCPEISTPLAIALTELPAQIVAQALQHLTEQQLLAESPGDRYRLHDLIRLYFHEFAVKTPEETRRSALHRVLDFFALNVAHADRLLFAGSIFVSQYTSRHPVNAGFSTASEAHDWIERELANIMAVVGQASASPEAHGALIVELARSLRSALYDRFGRYAELARLCETAISVTQRISHPSGEAYAHDGLAIALLGLGELERAIPVGQRAIELMREVSDRAGEARTLLVLSFIHRRMRSFPAAMDCLTKGIEICMLAGYPSIEANLRDNLGTVLQQLGRFEEAVSSHLHGLRLRRDAGFELGIAASLENLGWAVLHAGRPREALEHFHESAELCGRISNFVLQAGALWGIGEAEHVLGHGQSARRARADSIGVLRRLSMIKDDEAALLLSQDAPEMPSALRAVSD